MLPHSEVVSRSVDFIRRLSFYRASEALRRERRHGTRSVRRRRRGSAAAPFHERRYVRSENETLGPYEGWRVKELIDQRRSAVERRSRASARPVGSVKDIPVFDIIVSAELGPSAKQAVSRAPSPGVETAACARRFGFASSLMSSTMCLINVMVVVASGIVGLAIGMTVGWIAARQGEQATLPIMSASSAR